MKQTLVSTPLLVWMRTVFANLQAAYLNIQQARSDISIHFQLFVPQLCFRAGVANLYLQRLVGNCANVPASLSRLNYYIMLTNNHISPI